jgi:phosphopantothenoylcysteine decarboxylase/phosphopantothenate--cysteine ligase
MLHDKTIVLGVTGGIAAYKAAELTRLYVKAGADVHVIMTRGAQEFITPLTLQTLSSNPVHTEMFNLLSEREVGHISLADRADVFVVAPATANLVGKVAGGIADDLLTTTIMATKAPVLLAPAMNVNMWENPIYQRNQADLEQLGYHFVQPAEGFLACGWEGKGKLADPAEIFEETIGLTLPNDLAGETVLVTAGPTREEIDPVRYISNYSSGKMGYAIARAARLRGAKVVLVSGPSALSQPVGVERICVTSAAEMKEAVLARCDEATIIVKAAAVADYRPAHRAEHKMKKHNTDALNLELEKNPDILSELGRRKGHRTLVGFAAETRDLLENARKKLTEKNLDLIVANDITQQHAGFDVDTNVVRLLAPDGSEEILPEMSKDEVAHRLLDRILALRG